MALRNIKRLIFHLLTLMVIHSRIPMECKDQLKEVTLDNITIAVFQNDRDYMKTFEEIKAKNGFCDAEYYSDLCWPTTVPGNRSRAQCMDTFAYRECTERTTKNKSFVEVGPEKIYRFEWDEYVIAKECMEYIKQHSNIYGYLENIGLFGYTLSLISSLIASIILMALRRIRCTRNFIHMNLFISIFLKAFINVFLKIQSLIKVKTSVDVTETQNDAEHIILNMTMFFTYSWIFIEALHLHNSLILIKMLNSRKLLMIYILFGWTCPIFFTVIWYILTTYKFEDSILKYDRLMLIFFPSVVVLCNVCFFINILRVLVVKMQSRNHQVDGRTLKLLKSTIVLVIVFSLYHVILLPIDIQENIFRQKTLNKNEMGKIGYQQVIASFHGLIIAIILCFSNMEVVNELRRLYNQWKQNTIKADTRANSTRAKTNISYL